MWSLTTLEMNNSKFSSKIKLFTEEKVVGAEPELSRREVVGSIEKKVQVSMRRRAEVNRTEKF